MPLQLGSSVIGVKTRATPVVVGIVGVGRELEEDRTLLSRGGRTNHKEELCGRAPLIAVYEGAAVVLGRKRDFVVPGSPGFRDDKGVTYGPVASVARSVFWDRMS